jgi:ACS family sodium-dependent inorganic phosphate cotransporter-like MFS transporter 5
MAILAFFGFILNYMLRINMSIAIVAMARSKSSVLPDDGELTRIHDHGYGISNSTAEDGEFDWDEQTQSLIIGSFFWGYILTQIPGGRLAELFGSKYIFGLSILFSGLATLAVPFLSEEDPTKLICLRIFIGILEGATYPSMHALLARWAPPMERSRLTSIVYSGSQAGTVITLPMGGFIISALGWRYIFYIMGALPIVWTFFWMYFVFDSPRSHPRIGKKELEYLEANLNLSEPSGTKVSTKTKVPWKSIATSMPFWAIVVSTLSSGWGFWTLLTLLPTYMKNILHFDIKANSLLSALPYIIMWIFGIAFSFFVDYLRRISYLSTGGVRKLATIICLALPAVTLFIVTFVGYDRLATVALFTFGVGMSGGKYSAYLSNHIDIAPNFAGTLLGVANCFATIPGWLAPLTAARLTNGQQTLEQWHKVFYIASLVYIFGCVFYLIFGSGEVAPWNSATAPEAGTENARKDEADSKSEHVTLSSTSSTLTV